MDQERETAGAEETEKGLEGGEKGSTQIYPSNPTRLRHYLETLHPDYHHLIDRGTKDGQPRFQCAVGAPRMKKAGGGNESSEKGGESTRRRTIGQEYRPPITMFIRDCEKHPPAPPLAQSNAANLLVLMAELVKLAPDEISKAAEKLIQLLLGGQIEGHDGDVLMADLPVITNLIKAPRGPKCDRRLSNFNVSTELKDLE